MCCHTLRGRRIYDRAVVAASDGCERLAQALNMVAAKRCPGEVRVVATPFYWGEAAIFGVHEDNWPAVFNYVVHLVDLVNPELVHVRVLPEHGSLVFAVVPLTEKAADELAAGLEADP